MSKLFEGPVQPLLSTTQRRVAMFEVPSEPDLIRHAQGYDAFVELVGENTAMRLSAAGTLTQIERRSSEVGAWLHDLDRSAAIFLGNRIIQEVPHAKWRVYGADGLEIATENAAYDVAAAVRSAREGTGNPREGLRRFSGIARRDGLPS